MVAWIAAVRPAVTGAVAVSAALGCLLPLIVALARTAPAARRQQLVDADGNPVPRTTGRPAAAKRQSARSAPKREPVKPIDEVRLGRVKAAIWQNEVQTEDGKGFVRYGVTFERIYRNAEGQWRGTSSFGKDDLLLLAKVAEAAFERVNDIQLERPI